MRFASVFTKVAATFAIALLSLRFLYGTEAGHRLVWLIPEQAWSALERRLGAVVACVLHPEFGRDEQFFPVDAMTFDRGADSLLIAVGSRGVEQPIADVDCVADAALALRWVGYLENTEAENRHLDAVVERDVGNGAGHGVSFS